MRVVTFRDAGGRVRVGRVDAGNDLETPPGEGRVRVLAAASMLAWLAGHGREETGEERSLAGVELLAPVPEPPSVRDFYAFEEHVATGWRRRGGEIPEAWYEAPTFYFSNPASIHGPGEPVTKPASTSMLDFEAEIAAVLDAKGEIAGFTLLNDWSARDVQRREMTVGLGPAKGKDFAISLGPALVTPGELHYEDGRLELEVVVSVNGSELSRTNAREQHFAWPELVAHAGRDTRLRAGDVLGSGTLNRGCMLELGPLDDSGRERWLEPGDTVEIAAEGLGRLRTRIV